MAGKAKQGGRKTLQDSLLYPPQSTEHLEILQRQMKSGRGRSNSLLLKSETVNSLPQPREKKEA